MNYTAVNTKIKAMRKNLLTARDYEFLCNNEKEISINIDDDLKKIAVYLDKPARDFLRNYINGANILSISSLCDKSDRQSLKRIFGTETDLRNILWVYRLKKYHNINGSAVFSYLNPFNYRLSTTEISQLAHAKDMEHFAQIVNNSCYNFFNDLSEQKLAKAVQLQFKKEYPRENIAVICGYFYSRLLEIKNIGIIEKGKKHGFTTEEILSRLY